MNRPSTFAVFSYDNSPDASEIKMVTFKGPKEALDHLKTPRGQHYDGYIVPNTAAEREAFPYRNKVGPLRADDSNYWGYRFQVPNTADVFALWIEKQEVGEGYRTLKEDFQEEWVAEWVKRCDWDYVVHSHAQIERDQAHGGRWNEDKGDFMFDEELEDEAGEHEIAASGQVIEQAEKKDGNQKDGEKKDGLPVGQQKDVALR